MTDVEKREKVIRGLECCITCDPDGSRECKKCPYRRKGITNEPCFNALHADVLVLLKEQEPRVMTLQELQAIETPWNRNTPPYLWVEGRSATTESRWMSWGFMHDCVILPGTMGVQNYGSKWRVWNLQPTSEQMRDTKWEGDSDAEVH